jgi:retron-type reverse transcriptase
VLDNGSYRPLAARRVLIPKPGSGKLRMLGIPTGTAYCAVALVL